MDVSAHMKLARRAFEYVQQGQGNDDGTGAVVADGSRMLATIAITMTMLIYCVSLIKIRYTLGAVISTLAIVEEADKNMLVEIDGSDDEGLDKKDVDGLLEPEIAVIKVKAVTSKLRTAKAHLKAHGGRGASFRGFSLHIIYGILRMILSGWAASYNLGHAAAFAMIAAEVLLAKLEMVWVHQVISESSVSWFKRKQSFAVPWVKIAPAALLKAVAFQAAVGLPSALSCAYAPIHRMAHGQNQSLTPTEVQQGALLFAGSVVACLALMVLVYVPAHVTFVRVAASLLPEEENTLVNFDRTFGGRLSVGDKLGLMTAWTTFRWEQRRRYLGLWLKIVAIVAAITVLFAGILGFEVNYFLDVPEVVKALRLR